MKNFPDGRAALTAFPAAGLKKQTQGDKKMNTTETHAVHGPSMEAVLGGIAANSITEGIGAIGTIALAVIGLAGLYAYEMAAIATIVIGAVILMQGGLVSLACRRLSAQGVSERHTRELGGGVTAEFFGGLAGIVLGILSLFQAAPDTLLAVAVLVFGAALLLGGGTVSRLGWLLQTQNQTTPPDTSGAVVAVGSGGHMLIGLATVVLGILAVIGLVPMTLILVGLLCLGASALFSGSTINGSVAQ
jgi:hypothetical protein